MRRIGLINGDDVPAVGTESPQHNEKTTAKTEMSEKDKKRKKPTGA